MIILLLLIISVLAGMMLRKYQAVGHLGKTATLTVWLLIFVFGISLGSNKQIVDDFARFGMTAVVIALTGVAGSVIAARLLQSVIDQNRKK